MLKLDGIVSSMGKVIIQYYNMVGYVYLSTCIVTQKVYVGITIQNYTKRWEDHIKYSFNPNSNSYNHRFHRAIRKYGKDNFTWTIIETVQSESRNMLTASLKELEIKYIKYYDSYNTGYNSTKGGDTSRKECKSINVYNENGDLLTSFSSAIEASDYYKISKSVIYQCCGRFTMYSLWKGIRLIFRYNIDTVTKKDLEELWQNHYNTSVSMYDTNGKFLQAFTTITEASTALNISRIRITDNCSKKTSFVLINGIRYIFRYFNEYPTETEVQALNKIKSNPKTRVRAIDIITNKILGDFESQYTAGKHFKIRPSNISEICSGKRKSAGKYNGHPILWLKI